MKAAFKKPRVALFTPLPPCKTGTADYGVSLAEEMEKLVSLSVYEKEPFGFAPESFDSVVYQIGNNPYHTPIYKTALRHPGVVVLHEATVHNLVRSMTLNRGNHGGYLRQVAYEIFGDDLRYAAAKRFPIESPQPQEFLMLRSLVKKSRACIVHSHYAERLVRLKEFRGPIGVVPHGVTLRTIDARRYRQNLKLDVHVPLIGVFGYQRPDKQVWECLLMFKELVDRLPDARLLVLGEPSPQVPLEEGIRDLGLENHVVVRGHQTLEDFDGYLGACTAVLNLRKTTFGETSGTMMRAFSLARPVVVSDIGSAKELSDDICIKIPRDRHEGQVMAECLKWLVTNPEKAAEIGASARQWVAAECTWNTVAHRYVEFLQHVYRGSSSRTMGSNRQGTKNPRCECPPLSDAVVSSYVSRWINSESSAGEYFAKHSVRLLRTLQLIPRGDSNSRILELGCYMQITPALRGLLGYGEVRGAYMGGLGGWKRSNVTANDGEEFSCTVDEFNCEVDRFPYPDGFFETVLCCELLEHLHRDPIHMMSEINRVLTRISNLISASRPCSGLQRLYL